MREGRCSSILSAYTCAVPARIASDQVRFEGTDGSSAQAMSSSRTSAAVSPLVDGNATTVALPLFMIFRTYVVDEVVRAHLSSRWLWVPQRQLRPTVALVSGKS